MEAALGYSLQQTRNYNPDASAQFSMRTSSILLRQHANQILSYASFIWRSFVISRKTFCFFCFFISTYISVLCKLSICHRLHFILWGDQLPLFICLWSELCIPLLRSLWLWHLEKV